MKSLDLDNQMFITCGQDEPHMSLINTHFSCVIGVYFLSFIYDHPVFSIYRWKMATKWPVFSNTLKTRNKMPTWLDFLKSVTDETSAKVKKRY